MNKKIALLSLFIAFSLSGCFGIGGDNNKQPVTSGKLFENEEISIRYASSWNQINPGQGNFPTNMIVGFQNLTATEEFFANVNVTSEASSGITESREFGEKVLQTFKSSLPYFEEISREDIMLKIGENKVETYLVTFDAKQNNQNVPILRFQQTYLTKGDKSYIVTGSYAKSEEESVVNKISLMLKSFALK